MAHKPLIDSKIRDAKAAPQPYKLTDGKGLYLEVRPTGAKLWRYRYRIAGKENVFALGEYVRPAQIDETPEQKRGRFEAHRFTLEEARQQRHDARGLVKRNLHPKDERDALIAQRIQDNANTFEVVTREWLAHKADGWTAKWHDQIKRTLELHVFADLGKRPVNQPAKESARIILGIINRVKKRAPNTAANIRKWCSSVFCYAVTTLRADADPTLVLRDAIDLPETKHKTPLTKEQIPVLLHRIDSSQLFPMTRVALKLLLYIFKRPVEVRNAEWSEFDLEAAEWRIPAGKMKKRRAHVEPLSKQAVALLRELKAMTGGQKFVFPNYRRVGEPIAETTLIRALAAIGYEKVFTPHGFRATATTLLHELGFDEKLIDLSLAHKKRDKTTVSYDQYKYMPERRKLMQSWADYVDALCGGANVTPIRKHKTA